MHDQQLEQRDRDRIAGLERQARLDKDAIAGLEQQAGQDRADIARLQEQHVDDRAGAFDLLRSASQKTHRKVREVADDVLYTGVLDT
ncbi:MAG: hypothetical protein QOK10_668 [Pseudonocardiales bacterium]|jgi:hypothetical protein|nr:hypothetical protein [Pseudonocardiales bacterium]